MSTYASIWIELHDEHGYRGRWERKADGADGAYTSAAITAARAEAAKYAGDMSARLLTYDDGIHLAFGVFARIDPPDLWVPDFPASQWQWSDSAFRPEWDPCVAADLLGAYALVGVTTVSHDGAHPTKRQFHGRIVVCDQEKGISIDCEGYAMGRTEVLPPATNVWQNAEHEKTYHLRSTGEAVTGVDYLAVWTRTLPPTGGADPAAR